MKPASQLFNEAGVIWQHKNEFVPFLEFLRSAGVKSVLEIGTGLGGSAYCFGEITDHGVVVSVDFWKQGAARTEREKRRHQPNPNFIQIDGDSRTDAVESEVLLHAPYDLVYFDTEHAYEDCDDNYRRYSKMAMMLVAQHDINMDEEHWKDAGIPRRWREFIVGRDPATVTTFVNPSVDPRFPRWGGLGVVRV